MRLDQVKAVISGGVSGLGFAVARYLVDGGAQVTLLDINDDRGAEAVASLGDVATYVNTNVADEAAVSQAVDSAAAFMGGLNVAVACAGILGAGRALGREAPMPLDFFSNVININLVGTFNLAKAAAAVMAEQEAGADGERGVIVNTASVAAYEGQIGQVAYSASKGGVVGMTLPLAREFNRIGVRVMTIAPGIFHTPMVDGMTPELQEALASNIPFPQRLGKPEEFAQTVGSIVENSYLNGTTIRVDGAVRLQPK
ncbi:MAG: SDR family NAD(P)-dependent oxidoreductase [Pseudomonadota bacterium]